MEDVVRSSTIDAHARARRIVDAEGVEGLLEEVARLDSNAARRIYVEMAASVDGLGEEDAARIVRVAGREIGGSSRLRSTLVSLAEEFPAAWAVTGELIEAAENIASSSSKGQTLVELVRVRGLEIEDAEAMAEAVGTIASSGEIVRTLKKVAELAPSPEIVEVMLEPISSLSSSNDRRRALVDLTSYPELADSAYQRALELGREIASSGEKAAFLSTLVERMPEVEAMQRQFLEVAGGIASSGDQADALIALLRGSSLSEEICSLWVRTAGEIASSGTTATLLSEASRGCPDGEVVWSAYLAVVRDIPSSGDQRRALMALLDREGLDRRIIEEVESVADGAIASSGESQKVVKRTQSLLAGQVAPTD
jgi:hypothetical protein